MSNAALPAHCDFIFCAIQILLLTYLLTYLLAIISNMPTIRYYMYKVAKTDMRTEE